MSKITLKQSKLIGDRHFYKYLLGITVPIILQNLITNLISLIDNIMVGRLGTEEVAAVAIISQILVIYTLTLFGTVSGAGIFTTQYFGKGDHERLKYMIRYKVLAGLIITVIMCTVFLTLDDAIIGAYLSDGGYGDCDLAKTLELAKTYLRIVVIGFIPGAVTQVISGTLFESGNTTVPMIGGFCAIISNTVLNFILIFGIGCFEEMGVAGAAVATAVSRFVELAVVLWYVVRNIEKHSYFKSALKGLYIPGCEVRRILLKGIPLIINEFACSFGMSLVTLSYSKYGVAVIAGRNISGTVVSLFDTAFRAFGYAVGILAGKRLGAGMFEEAVSEVKKTNALAVAVSVLTAVAVFCVSGLIPSLYQVSDEAKETAVFFMRVSAVFMPLSCAANLLYFTMRAGGRIYTTFLLDGGFLLFVSVPTAFLLNGVLSVRMLAVVLSLTTVIKVVAGVILFERRVWVKKL